MELEAKDIIDQYDHPNMINENVSPENKPRHHDVIIDEYSTNAKSVQKNESGMPPINNFYRGSRGKLHTSKTIFAPEQTPKKKDLKGFITTILESNIELLIMAVFTCFALFGSDLKVIFLTPKDDDIFNGIYLFVLILFLLEFFCNWYVKPTYVMTFFFWLDLMSIMSMFLEIDWILNPLVDEFIMYNYLI
jgi:hypothetical protein